MKGRAKVVLIVALAWLLVSCLWLLNAIVLEMSYGPATYHGSNHLTTAPDGVYECWVSRLEEPNLVWFPLCPSYGGELHGVWLYDVDSVNLTEWTWYKICLIDNVVVYAER